MDRPGFRLSGQSLSSTDPGLRRAQSNELDRSDERRFPTVGRGAGARCSRAGPRTALPVAGSTLLGGPYGPYCPQHFLLQRLDRRLASQYGQVGRGGTGMRRGPDCSNTLPVHACRVWLCEATFLAGGRFSARTGVTLRALPTRRFPMYQTTLPLSLWASRQLLLYDEEA